MICEVHQFNQRFATIQELKEKIMEEFSDQLPEAMDYQVGYFHGKQSAKRWIMTQEDLNLMYESKKENILLWADARVQCPNTNGSSSRGQKRKAADLFREVTVQRHCYACVWYFCILRVNRKSIKWTWAEPFEMNVKDRARVKFGRW